MMNTIIKDTDFQRVAESVKPDAKKRVVLPKLPEQEGITYHIYSNRMGQIVLDPLNLLGLGARKLKDARKITSTAEDWFTNPKAIDD